MMRATNLTRLGAWDPESGALNAIIETPKGSRNKLKYDADQGLFELIRLVQRAGGQAIQAGRPPRPAHRRTVGEEGRQAARGGERRQRATGLSLNSG
jgi:hypothetical protein